MTTALVALPNFPQLKLLPAIVEKLWTCPEIKGIWLGGSFTSGTADEYSDVDIRAAVDKSAIDNWRSRDLRPFFGDEYLEGQTHDFTGNGILRHFVGASGFVYDLWVVDIDKDLPPDNVLLLACRDDSLRARLDLVRPMPVLDPSVADPATIRGLLVDYWITTSKDVKVVHRGLGIVLNAGLEVQRSYLLRLWYVLATGNDPGTSRVTIHLMSRMLPPVIAMMGTAAQEMIGAPARTMDEIKLSIERNRYEVSRVGRLLADRLGFEYPEKIEHAVREKWHGVSG